MKLQVYPEESACFSLVVEVLNSDILIQENFMIQLIRARNIAKIIPRNCVLD